ncbi:hypothetical protein IWW55_006944, partial [Coemansia sp. RSA 2706]
SGSDDSDSDADDSSVDSVSLLLLLLLSLAASSDTLSLVGSASTDDDSGDGSTAVSSLKVSVTGAGCKSVAAVSGKVGSSVIVVSEAGPVAEGWGVGDAGGCGEGDGLSDVRDGSALGEGGPGDGSPVWSVLSEWVPSPVWPPVGCPDAVSVCADSAGGPLETDPPGLVATPDPLSAESEGCCGVPMP